MLIGALMLKPFFDNVWSQSVMPLSTWGYAAENYTELAVALSVLGGGAVGIGDMIGNSNVSLIMACAARDGTLLSPSIPSTYIDATFLPVATQLWPVSVGRIFQSASFISQSRLSSTRDSASGIWMTVLAVDIEPLVTLTLSDFYPDLSSQVLNYAVVRWSPGFERIASMCASGVLASSSGIFTHAFEKAIRHGEHDVLSIIDTIHFDDEEDANIQRNLQLSGSPVSSHKKERVHLSLLDDGQQHFRTVGGKVPPWWTQFPDGTFDVVVVLPKVGQTYPVKPTPMTSEENRISRTCVILAEAIRVVKSEGHLLLADDALSALTTLTDLALVTGPACVEAASISEDPSVKIGHISSYFDSRFIVIDIDIHASQVTKNTFLTAGEIVNSTEESEVSLVQETEVRKRKEAVRRFHFDFGLTLDFVVFALLSLVALATGAKTSVPTSVPPMLRVGPTFGFIPYLYPTFSLLLRWSECDVYYYNSQFWRDPVKVAMVYFRTMCKALFFEILFILVLNYPFMGVAVSGTGDGSLHS